MDAGGNDERGDGFFLSAGWVLPSGWLPSPLDVELGVRHSEAVWDTSRERFFAGSAAERRTRILTIEHQLLLGG